MDAKDIKKAYLKFYAILFAIIFLIVLGIFVGRYFILGYALIEESWAAEIIKYLFGYACIAVAAGVISWTPFTLFLQRKIHGLKG